jgi:GNAT superfamily N-acetyltransferase
MSDPEIRDLLPEDAPALGALFERCYGRSYGTPVFYDPDGLAALIDAGGLRSVVALISGDLVGHTGIRIHDPGARICETGNTVVDPAARGQGLLKKLGGALRSRVIREGFAGYVHFPTTAHEIMQRASVSGGGCETGLMLAYIAETTEYAAVDRPAGRLAATVAFQPLADLPPRTVCVPRPYRELMGGIYREAGLDRTVTAESGERAPESEVVSMLHSDRGVLSLKAHRDGCDLAERVATLLDSHRPEVAHVDVLLDEPAITAMVGELNRLGFLFCGLLPEFGRTDVLRLQWLGPSARSAFEPELANPTARRLCRFIRAETGLE